MKIISSNYGNNFDVFIVKIESVTCNVYFKFKNLEKWIFKVTESLYFLPGFVWGVNISEISYLNLKESVSIATK